MFFIFTMAACGFGISAAIGEYNDQVIKQEIVETIPSGIVYHDHQVDVIIDDKLYQYTDHKYVDGINDSTIFIKTYDVERDGDKNLVNVKPKID